DGNNVAHSLMLAVAKTGATLRIATPAGYEPLPRYRDLAEAAAKRTGASITIGNAPAAAVADADVVYTDVWTSMGQEQEYERRRPTIRIVALTADRSCVAHAKDRRTSSRIWPRPTDTSRTWSAAARRSSLRMANA